ncbi:MAG: CHAD domain-containing protein [Pseudomonadota bacterium]
MIFGQALKLKVSKETADKLVSGSKVHGMSAHMTADTRISETFFDNARYGFFKSGITFNLRVEGGEHTQVVRQSHGDAIETVWTTPLSPHIQTLVLSDVWAADLGLKPRTTPPGRRIFTSDFRQRSFEMSRKKAGFTVNIKQGELRIAGPVFKNVAEPFIDMELMPVSGSETVLFDFALELVEAAGARIQPDTRISRGFALASRSLQKAHSKAKKVKLEPAMSVGEALETIVQNTVSHLLDNQTAALRGDVNGVHQTRVAMRRLRAALRAFKAVLPYEGRKAFNGELRWFQQRTGPARDWHVFADETLPRLKPSDVSAEEMAVLRKLAAQEGKMHGQEAALLLQSRRYTRLLLRFGRWVGELFEDDRYEGLKGPVVPFARKTLAKTHRDLLRTIKDARPGVIEDLHKVRIRGKKARYAGEFFAVLFDGEDAQAYISLVEDLQDRLGAANDARVARGLVAELEHGKLMPGTNDGIQSWSSRRVAKCVDQARPTLRALHTVQKFWKKT